MSAPQFHLGVVIPLSRPRREIPMIAKWIQLAIDKDMELVFVIDEKVSKEIAEFLDFFNNYKSDAIKIVCGAFGSPGESRNEGLRHMRSEWVAFWDGDDEPLVKEFHEMVLTADKNGYSIAFGGFQTKSLVTGEIVSFPVFQEEENFKKSIVSHPGLWRFAFKRSSLSEVSFQNLSMGEDVVYVSTIVIKFKKILCYNAFVYTYSIHDEGSLTSSKKNFRDGLSAANVLRKSITHSEDPDFLYVMSMRLCLGAAKHGDFAVKIRSLFWLLNSIFKYPGMFLRSWPTVFKKSR